MKGFITNIEKETMDNSHYRKVLYTTKNSQLVLMNIQSGDEIGEEIHELDQFIRFESGTGKVVLNDVETEIAENFAVVIPAGVKHNVINSGKAEMKLYTIYTPPEHRFDVVHKTKADAEQDNEHFDGKRTE